MNSAYLSKDKGRKGKQSCFHTDYSGIDSEGY